MHEMQFVKFVHSCRHLIIHRLQFGLLVEILRYKVFEPVLLLGSSKFANVDIRVRVKGGGQVAQIYAVRQAIAKSIVAYYQKCKCVRQSM